MLLDLATGLADSQVHQTMRGEVTITVEGGKLTVPMTAQGLFQVRVVDEE